jgi:poly-gamma-glutamate capsule biosynthesis protein CapA/YwtB (metallophosphatase superfamily)
MEKQNCDVKIISLHWGREYKINPLSSQTKLAHNLIDF